MSAVEVKRRVSPSVVRGCVSFLSATCRAVRSALLMFVLAILQLFSCLSFWGWAVENMFWAHPSRHPSSGQVMSRVDDG